MSTTHENNIWGMFQFKPDQIIASRYKVRALLGDFGHGAVFQATDTSQNDKPIALKVYFIPDEEKCETTYAKFRKEALFAQKHSHEHLLSVFDYGTDAATQYHYKAMPLMSANLRSLIPGENGIQLTFPELLRIATEIAQGLGYIHQQGVLHGNLKPENVLLDTDGTVKLSDCGLARQVDMGQASFSLHNRFICYDYIPPETLGSANLHVADDIYAFGILVYELSTGVLPYGKIRTTFTLKHKALTDPFPPFTGSALNFPNWFYAVIQGCAEKRAAERWQSFDEIVELLTTRAQEPFNDEPLINPHLKPVTPEAEPPKAPRFSIWSYFPFRLFRKGDRA